MPLPQLTASTPTRLIPLRITISLLLSPTIAFSQVPDLTRGGEIPSDDRTRWNLGPTGAKGWIYSNKHTNNARQIAVTEIASNSPATGNLQVGDVIIGIGNSRFTSDARIAYSEAIANAEAGANNGQLNLLVWRANSTIGVSLNLRTMGQYSSTSPYDCPKTAAIFQLGCERIASRGLRSIDIPTSFNALALLASGKPQYRSALEDYARRVSNFSSGSRQTWNYGHAMIFLSEYILATGDTSVRPGLNRIATEVANGQGTMGSWGHGFANHFGMPSGYGALNMAGVQAAIGLVLSHEAGVNNPTVNQAITKLERFFGIYFERGSVTYGDHGYWTDHTTNGKTAAAAVLFDLLRKPAQTEFFSRMTAAGYQEREITYSSLYFRPIWNMLAQSRCGEGMTTACWKEQSWYYDFARKWDGSFDYQPGAKGTSEYFTPTTRWDHTGAYLLTYALPLRSLYITGKQPSSMPPLNSSEISETISAGRGYFQDISEDQGYFPSQSTQTLVNNLSSWSPPLRLRSINELARRQANVYPQILSLLNSSNRYSIMGASLAAAKTNGSPSQKQQAVQKLRNLLSHQNLSVRLMVIESLREIGSYGKAAIPDLISIIRTPTDLTQDPMSLEKRTVSETLFARPHRKPQGLLANRNALLNDISRSDLWETITLGLDDPHGFTRAHYRVVLSQLSLQELGPVHAALKEGITQTALTGVKGVSDLKIEGIGVFVDNLIEDGIDLIVDYA